MRSFRIIAVLVIGALLIIQGCGKGEQTTVSTQDSSSIHTDTPYYAGLWKVYKDSIPGTWTWHHTYILLSSFNTDTTYIIDTIQTLPISLVNDSTLRMGGDVLSYSDSIHYTPKLGERVDTSNFVHYWAIGQYHAFGAFSADLTLNRRTGDLVYLINKTGTALGSQRYEHWRTKIR